MTRAWPSQLLLYGLPGLPLAMLGLPLYVYLPTFYAETLGLSLSAVGVALLAARSLDIVTDPFLGWLNDRTSSQFGRRKLFMLLGIPLLLVGLDYLLRPLPPVDGWYLFWWSSITYLGWTLISVPWQAWGAELTTGYHAKSSLAASREAFAIVGTVLVMTLPVALGISQDQTQTLAVVSGLLWWLLPLSVLPTILFLAEKPPARRLALLPSYRHLLQAHPAIPRLLPAYFINSIANALPATLFLLFVTHQLQAAEHSGVLLLAYFLSGLLGLPCWLWLAKRIDKAKAWASALLLAVAAFAAVPWLGAGDWQWFFVICVLSGLALGADVALPASIQADITQQLEQQGNPNSGLLFGLWGLLTKLALALAVGVAFPLLDTVGFAQNATQQTPSALATLVVLYAAVPVALKVLVAWQMWRFPFRAGDFRNYWEMGHVQTPHSVASVPATGSQRMQQHED